MHKEILNEQQLKLLPFLKFFKKDFFLVGGTAMALYIGHRKSVDFDLFTNKKLSKKSIIKKIRDGKLKVNAVLIDNEDEYTIVLNDVKFTFLFYPFDIKATNSFENFIEMPELLDLAAMKAYAIGRRATLKDYVDMYFVFKEYATLAKVVTQAKKIFGNFFSEKLFREQLCYFEDVDLNEKLDFIGRKIDVSMMEKYLSEVALS